MDELIARLEKCQGPDIDLNESIAIEALGWKRRARGGRFPWEWPDGCVARGVPNFTGSIDAALTLVPGGWYINLDSLSDGWRALICPDSTVRHRSEQCANGALAVAIAALKARRYLPTQPRQPRAEGE